VKFKEVQRNVRFCFDTTEKQCVRQIVAY